METTTTPITTLTTTQTTLSLTVTEFQALNEQLAINVSKIEKLNLSNSGTNTLVYREILCSVNNLKAALDILAKSETTNGTTSSVK